MVHKIGAVKQLKVCYEAGPTGYVLYWQLTQLGVACDVIAQHHIGVTAFGLVLVATKTGDTRKKPLERTPLADNLIVQFGHSRSFLIPSLS